MDTSLFEGVDEAAKAHFVGNFFHFIKCRFNDCNLIQTKAKINMDTKEPSAKVSKVAVDKQNSQDWASGKGNNVPAWSANNAEYVQTNQSNPSGATMKAAVDVQNMKDWASGKGNNVPAWSAPHAEYIQTNKESPEKQTVNQLPQVKEELKKDAQQELVKPTTVNNNQKDAEPQNVQVQNEIKK